MFKKIFIVTLVFIFSFNQVIALEEQNTNHTTGIFLNYSDLVELSKTPKPQGELGSNLELQLTTPIIKQPPQDQVNFLHGSTLGDFFRFTSWNIERGFQVNRIIEIPTYSIDLKTSDNLKKELEIFSKASIIALNEVDIGVPRTNYENIVEKIADAYKMGYVFGTEFIEVDPYQLGVKRFSEKERVFLEAEALRQLDNINEEKYHGLHGTAILSKYPILNAKIIRLPDCYNWYLKESEKISALELIKRGAASSVFSAKVLTELRHGGRIGLLADLQLPNGQIVTVVSTHLENRCLPDCRYKQFEFLLNRLRAIENPLILAGDLNTTGTDASPTSVKKEVLTRVKDPQYVAKQAILALTPISFIQNVVLGTLNSFRQFKDPTARNIPILFPNKERKIFDLVKDYRFNDGKAFDIRGTLEKTHKGYYALLSNSNERDIKGFKPTFELERHLGVARYKLDWIFIKPLNLKDSNNKKGSYAYAPHFGRTLSELNRSFGKISDHDPVSVDISIGEPIH